MYDLKDTIELMTSDDYKERFVAEYWQTVIRYRKLYDLVQTWDSLEFTPDCPIEMFELQLQAMENYLKILRARAQIEGVSLDGTNN